LRALSIVVPVFNSAEAVERCLDALMRCRPRGSGVVVVNDASTDARIAPLLARFAGLHSRVRVETAPENRGYIAAANLGASASPAESDLLFLNSDTELTPGSVDEMFDALEQRPDAAICCPLSNNAAFLSVPRFQQVNTLPRAMGPDDVASLVRESAGSLSIVDIPSPVGFCMLVRRPAWHACGPFDEAYGRGYGEEDDFGERVRARGGAVICATRAYVYHRGAASFGTSPELTEQRRANGRLLATRWPGYAPRMQEFSRSNPLRPLQERLWDALLSAPERRQVHVMHLVSRWETAGPLRAAMLELCGATRNFANHTIVAPVPEPKHGAWIDAIDHEAHAGVRVVGLVKPETAFARFFEASPATMVHVHGTGLGDAAVLEIARRSRRPVLETPEAPMDIARCADAYRRFSP
jgi:GT2 family glycosyltransferase